MGLAFVLLDFQHAGVRITRQKGNIEAPLVLLYDTALPGIDEINDNAVNFSWQTHMYTKETKQ